MDSKNYFIRNDYVIREHNEVLDTSERTDEYQNDVYLYAQNIAKSNNLKSIADVGCGSAFKLIKYFNNYNITGFELKETVELLKTKHPQYNWIVSDFNDEPEEFDMVICADVIEHILHPNPLLEYIWKMKPKHIIISTPDRDLLVEKLGRSSLGPPKNKYHVREWSYSEFKNYIESYFKILDHKKIDHEYGQLIHCTI